MIVVNVYSLAMVAHPIPKGVNWRHSGERLLWPCREAGFAGLLLNRDTIFEHGLFSVMKMGL